MRWLLTTALCLASARAADFFSCPAQKTHAFAGELVEHALSFNKSVQDFDLALQLDDRLDDLVKEQDLDELVEEWLELERQRHRLLMAAELEARNISFWPGLYNLSALPQLLRPSGARDWGCAEQEDPSSCAQAHGQLLEQARQASDALLARLRDLLDGKETVSPDGQALHQLTNRQYGDVAVEVRFAGQRLEAGHLELFYKVRSAARLYKQCFYGGPLAGFLGNFISQKLCDEQGCYPVGQCRPAQFGFFVC